ncbi:hypothetical protein Emag_005177 [Eimeria magna]
MAVARVSKALICLLIFLLPCLFIELRDCFVLRQCKGVSGALITGGDAALGAPYILWGGPFALESISVRPAFLAASQQVYKNAFAPALTAVVPKAQAAQRLRASRRGQQQQAQRSSRGRRDCLSLAGRVIACLPGSKFRVQIDEAAAASAAAAAAAAAAPAYSDALEVPEGLKGKSLICSLSGKLRINRVYVQLHDVVILEVNPLSPNEGRVVFRVRERPSATSASAAATA